MKIDWTILNAYVDGELDARQAAIVAVAVAAAPELAARVASLRRLKAETAQLRAAPQPAATQPPARRPAILRPAAIAALLALVIATAALGLTVIQRPTGGDPAWLAAAVAIHEDWLAQGHGDGPVPAALGTARRDAPDLGDAHLFLVHAARFADGGFFGYEGIHGCHVGLWTGPADAAVLPDEAAPRLLQRDGVHAYAWSERGRLHLLMARGMPDARLGRLAELVATILRRDRRLDDHLRLALQATAGMAPPCA